MEGSEKSGLKETLNTTFSPADLLVNFRSITKDAQAVQSSFFEKKISRNSTYKLNPLGRELRDDSEYLRAYTFTFQTRPDAYGTWHI